MKHVFSVEITEKIVLEYFAKLPVQERLDLLSRIMRRTRIKSIPHEQMSNLLLDKNTIGKLFSLSMKTPEQIARKYNVSTKEIEDVLTGLGYKLFPTKRPGRKRVIDVNQILESLKTKSATEVAKLFNISVSYTYKIKKDGKGKV